MQGQSILRQNQTGTEPAVVDTDTIVKAVQNDMLQTEKGNQWILSCYAPFKEKGMFPGFEDKSTEEVRFGYYEAHKNGTLDHFKQQLQTLLEEAAMKIRSLQYPTAELINKVKEIYNRSPGNVQQQLQHQSDPFQNIANTSAFSKNASIFNNAQQPIPSQQAVGTTTSIFGGQLSIPYQPLNNPIFGGQQIVPNTSSSIGEQQQLNSRVGSVNNNFPMSESGASQSPSQSIFQKTIEGMAAGNASATSVAGNVVASVTRSTTNVDLSLYTSTENLSTSDLQVYKQPDFLMKHIPEQAPPYQLCFT